MWHEVGSGRSGQCPAFSQRTAQMTSLECGSQSPVCGQHPPPPHNTQEAGRLAQKALRTEWTAKDSKSLSLKNIYSSVWEEPKAEGKQSSLKQHTLQESSPGFKGGGVRVVRERGRGATTSVDLSLCVGWMDMFVSGGQPVKASVCGHSQITKGMRK